MQYYLSVPTAWTPAKKWSILVTLDGANSDFLHNAQTFMQARNAEPFIIVTPFIVSNTGKDTNHSKYNYSLDVWAEINRTGSISFDESGVLQIVAEVQKHYNGEDKFFVTGWSGGGNLSWWLTFKYPEKLAGVALAAANYFGFGKTYTASSEVAATDFSSAPERRDLPIRGFQGDLDPSFAGLSQQWDTVQKVATAQGYNNVTRQIIIGQPHSPFADEVIKFFSNYLGSGKNQTLGLPKL